MEKSLNSLPKRLLAYSFIYASVVLGVFAIENNSFHSEKIFYYFMLPFYLVAFVMEWILPKQGEPNEKNEIATDIISTVVATAISMMQGAAIVFFFASATSSLFVKLGWMSVGGGLQQQPFWLELIVVLLLADLFSYIFHRACHEIPLLWRFHSIHHSAHKVTFINAFRVHPVDTIIRRSIPVLIMIQFGISQEAFIATGVIGSVLATITHMNVDLRHKWLNYVIGTNEIHRWHHSTVYSEAKNFSVFMLWDHLFGTFYYPRDRDMPERLGLGDETNYPRHNYWQMLWLPFHWDRLKYAPELANETVGTASSVVVEKEQQT